MSRIPVTGKAALYVPPDDSSALGRELELLIHDERRRQDLGRKASIRGADFTLERMAKAYLAAYSELLRDNPDFEGKQMGQEAVCAF